MKVPISWIKDFVDITLPLDELAKLIKGEKEKEVLKELSPAESEAPSTSA